MKPIYVNFIQVRNHWWIWGAALVICIFLLYAFLNAKVEIIRQDNLLEQKISKLQENISQVENESLQITHQPRAADLKIVHEILQQDVNKIFNVVESEFDKGVKLKALSFDIISAQVKLEYDIKSLDGVVGVANALNAGYDARPWKIESVAESTEGNSVLGFAQSKYFRSVWGAHLDSL